jgi:hypothetical protein
MKPGEHRFFQTGCYDPDMTEALDPYIEDEIMDRLHRTPIDDYGRSAIPLIIARVGHPTSLVI